MHSKSSEILRTAGMMPRLWILLLLLFFLALSAYQFQPQLIEKHHIFAHSTAKHHEESFRDIYNSTLGFEKIFVVNLPSRRDLRDAVTLAATLTGLDVEFVDGVVGDEIASNSLPDGVEDTGLRSGELGNWRAHMDVAQIIVNRNIQSALVLESDADWDIRIKHQMKEFAQGSRMLLQPLKDRNATTSFLDPTIPQPEESDTPSSFDVFRSERSHPTVPPTTSPYGDLERWDLLWLGHCGARFPRAIDGNAPLGRAVIPNDVTVPEKHHIDIEYGDYQLLEEYDDHTRVVSRARTNLCTLGHAFSLQGARKFLYELSVKKLSDTTDVMFRSMCDGLDGRPLSTCLTVQPQLFQHHRPKGYKSKQSDISDHGDDYNPHGLTQNVRWSTRLNIPRLIANRTDYVDSFMDGVEGPTWSEE